MAFLLSCWFIVEAVVIPGGLWKWFFLSFYVHPVFLFPCQIFLWLVSLKTVIIAITCHVLEIVSFSGSSAYRFFKSCVIYVFMPTEVTSNLEVVEEVENLQNYTRNGMVDSCVSFGKTQIVYKVQVLKYEEDISFSVGKKQTVVEKLSLNENECLSDAIESYSLTKSVDITNQQELSPSSSSSSSSSAVGDLEMDEPLQSAPLALEAATGHDQDQDQDQESDPWYEIYAERMKWFDLLSHERRCGMSAILRNEPSSYFIGEEMARKRVLKSLESDMELVYVAQSCLSWEALHHQYTMVEFLTSCSGSQDEGALYDCNNVTGEFQNFQILLERFLEEERCQGDRFWSYVQGRSSLKSFLQVPEVSGFSGTKRDGRRGEATSVKEVLKVIEQCMKAYWEFVRADSKKSWWSFKTSPWAHPSVEDPRDLVFLADLTKNLQEKEKQLKDVWGRKKKMKKKKKWFKRGGEVRPVEDCQRMEILWAMIDMKLIWRVLQMSVVSSTNLRWCHEKLQLIEVKEGEVFRAWPGPMFPP